MLKRAFNKLVSKTQTVYSSYTCENNIADTFVDNYNNIYPCGFFPRGCQNHQAMIFVMLCTQMQGRPLTTAFYPRLWETHRLPRKQGSTCQAIVLTVITFARVLIL